MSVLDKVRRWIDGETAETVLEQAAPKEEAVEPKDTTNKRVKKRAGKKRSTRR